VGPSRPSQSSQAWVADWNLQVSLPMSVPDIILSLNADEMAILPEKSSVAEFLAYEDSCRIELLPKADGRASVISKDSIGPVAGSPIPSWWESDPLIKMKPVNLFKIRDAFYFPAYGVLIDRNGHALRSPMCEASYVTPDLLLLPHMRRVGDDIVFSPPEDLVTLSNVAVTMPWGALHNYGHFVLDCLPSIPCILGIDSLRGYDFAFPKLEKWHRGHLELFGVAPTELPHGCYRAETVIFTDCMRAFLLAPNQNLNAVPDIELSALGCEGGGSRNIYVSRRGNPKRIFRSEEKLEAVLRDRGFEIVRPETMPVREQIALFAESAVVVSCAGSTLINALYCSRGTVVVEIKPSSMTQAWTRHICIARGLKWAPYFCDSRPPDQATVYSGIERPEIGVSYDLALDDFLAYLDSVTGASHQVGRADA
jgi:capsular polysaccharide biosynthesis protein